MPDKNANNRAWFERLKETDPDRVASYGAASNERKTRVNNEVRAIADAHMSNWTPDDDATLLGLTESGHTAEAIARKLGRTVWAVRSRRRKLSA